jgi:hypothetical protein
MAVKDVNSNPLILPTYHLELTVFDGQCEADVVMKRFIDIIKTKDASRFQSTVGMLGTHKLFSSKSIFIIFPKDQLVLEQWSQLPECPNISVQL